MKFRIDLKILFFLALFYVTNQLELYIIIMMFCLIHECVHLLIALFFKFKIQEIEIMPFGFWISMQAKIEDYNRKVLKSNVVELKKIFIAIAGPLINLICVIIFANLNFIKQDIIVYSNLLIFIFNLIPIYPLDGGRVIQSLLRIFCGKICADNIMNKLANVFIILLTVFSSVIILYLKNIAILLILLYMWELVIRENKKFELKKKIYQCFEKNNI